MVEMPEKADEICRAVFKRLKERLPPLPDWAPAIYDVVWWLGGLGL